MTRFLSIQFLVPTITMTAMLAAAIYGIFFKLPPESAETFTGEYELTLSDYEGEAVELADFKRDLLVVHVWASWCPYCGEELQNLMRLKDEYEDIEVLAVNRAESLSEARAFTDLNGIDTTKIKLLIDDDDSFYKSIGGYAMPETLFIDTGGEIRFHQRGPLNMEEARVQVRTLLGE
ncbi:MAG: TlpA disulfide reductase family protein [Minisyncoccia bacterium]